MASKYAWAYDVAGAADGEYGFSLSVEDMVGNQTTVAVVDTLTLDASVPVVTNLVTLSSGAPATRFSAHLMVKARVSMPWHYPRTIKR